jgi:hypothetical protein
VGVRDGVCINRELGAEDILSVGMFLRLTPSQNQCPDYRVRLRNACRVRPSDSDEYAFHISPARGERIPAYVSHDPSLLPTLNTGCGATTGNTSSAPGTESILNLQLRSGPRPPLLMRNQPLIIRAIRASGLRNGPALCGG